MELAGVLDVVSKTLGQSLSYERALVGGFGEGAHLLLVGEGQPAVLKFGGPPGRWLVQIRQAAANADELRAMGYPTPRMWASGLVSAQEWWYLQDYVEGAVVTAADFGTQHFDQVLDLLRRNRGLAPATRQDWSRYVGELVFGHDHEWAVLETAGPLVASFLDRISRQVEELRQVELGHQDLVLGDAGPHNLIFRDGEIAAVIDFACAGRGDRIYDVVSLAGLFRDRPDFLSGLLDHEFTVGGGLGRPAVRRGQGAVPTELAYK